MEIRKKNKSKYDKNSKKTVFETGTLEVNEWF